VENLSNPPDPGAGASGVKDRGMIAIQVKYFILKNATFDAINYSLCGNQQCPVRFLQGGKTGTGVMGGPIFLN
jgi:hypothetical protein